MTDPRFHFLLQQFKEDRLSEADAAIFRAMVTSGEYDEWLEADLQNLLESNAIHPRWTAEKQESLLQATLKRLPEDAEEKTPVLRRRPVRTLWWAAAAVLVLGLGLSWWMLQSQKSGLATISTPRPGTNKAILKLGEGRQIVLDSNSSLQVENAHIANGEVAYSPGEHVSYNTLETPRGGQYRVVLPDGSKVWLNSASSLKYPTAFDAATREVVLSGEAYFEIANDRTKPFIVKTGSVDVHVLGTGFNVMAYADEGAVRTTLVNGAVKLAGGDGEQLLAPGQQASLNDGRFMVSTPDMEQVLAWKNGLFNFNGADIRAIMRQVMRWYDVEVVYKENLSAIELSGIISQKKDVRQLLEILEETGKVHFLLQGRKVTVLPGHSD
ncbi:MAG: FecR domain-containing protein [Bacteroidetes bacterium]|nr:FecR domain-containing protein [Bacteroidota bacterium]